MRRRDFLKNSALCCASVSSLGLSKSTAAENQSAADSPMPKAELVEPPKRIIPHTKKFASSGQSVVRLDSGKLLMAANESDGPGSSLAPMAHSSTDGGRTWKNIGRLAMKWNLSGRRIGGGVSFLKLKDGRLALLMHRGLNQGGGLPAISYSKDDGTTWTDAKLLDGPEGIWYVMNDRMIQTKAGRILVPVARGGGKREGDTNTALCFYSDDGGRSWFQSTKGVSLSGPRGMAEPCVAELADGQLLMLARTGKGSHHLSRSNDHGLTWSTPKPTTLIAACSPLTMKRLPNGQLIVLYNHIKPIRPGGFFPRCPLVYSVSSNNGETWGPATLIDAAQPFRQLIYPSICFTDEGMLVMYRVHYTKNSFGMTAQQKLIGGVMRCIVRPV